LTTELVCLTVTSRFYAQYCTIGLYRNVKKSSRSSVTMPYVMKPITAILLHLYADCLYD